MKFLLGRIMKIVIKCGGNYPVSYGVCVCGGGEGSLLGEIITGGGGDQIFS